MPARFWQLALVGLTLLAAPAARHIDAQAPATTCKDGTTSATTGRGACSGQGGVDAKATAAAKKAARASRGSGWTSRGSSFTGV